MIPVCSSVTRLLHHGAAQRLVALLSNTAAQQQQQWHCVTGWQRRSVWNESIDAREARKADSFYDSTIERYAEQPIETLSLEQVGAAASTHPAVRS